MASKIYKKMAIACALEGTYAVDAVPTGALNAMMVQNVKFTAAKVDSTARETASPYFRNDLKVVGAVWTEISFEVEGAGSGTAGTPPAYSALLRACGMAATVTAATKVVYNRVSEGFESASLYFERDGILARMLGVRGTAKLVGSTRKAFKWEISLTGLYQPLTDASLGNVVYTAFQAPLAMNKQNTPVFTLHGVNGLIVHDISFDLANQHGYRNPVNFEGVAITDSKPVGSIKFEATTIAAKNWVATMVAAAQGPLNLVHGTVAGNILAVSAPAAQLGDISEENVDGFLCYSAPLVFQPAAGNDELVFEIR